jgi:hypothetical protein
MTRDDIIRMALEHFGAVLKPSDLEVKLAALAVAQEREACAKVCEDIPLPQDPTALTHIPTLERCAAAIRARGDK